MPRISVKPEALAAPAGSVDPRALFGRSVDEVWLEMGFGGGEHLAAQAAAHPKVGIVGCEPYEGGVGSLLKHVAAGNLGNVRILPDDGRPLLESLAGASLARIFILFPDPWPKKRHHRRRLVAPGTLDQCARLLVDGGILRLATDDPAYAQAMDDVTAAHTSFRRLGGGVALAGWRPDEAPQSRYEAKAAKAGRPPVFFELERVRRSGS